MLTTFVKDVLSFNDMKVNLCFDQSKELIRGPHNNVQVIVIRSLVGKWIQTIYTIILTQQLQRNCYSNPFKLLKILELK